MKQRYAAEIYEAANKIPEIKSILLFGSSVTPLCHIDSDLDIYIETTTEDGKILSKIKQTIGDICGWDCDILLGCFTGEKLKKEIYEKGVVIYEVDFDESKER